MSELKNLGHTLSYDEDPDIAEAFASGYLLSDFTSREAEGAALSAKYSGKIELAEKGSEEWRNLIDNANQDSIILTSARAAYNRLSADEDAGESE